MQRKMIISNSFPFPLAISNRLLRSSRASEGAEFSHIPSHMHLSTSTHHPPGLISLASHYSQKARPTDSQGRRHAFLGSRALFGRCTPAYHLLYHRPRFPQCRPQATLCKVWRSQEASAYCLWIPKK